MQQDVVQPDPVTFVGVLNACTSIMALEESRCIHEQIIKCGCQIDGFVRSSLVDMYAKCVSMDNVHQVFKKMLPCSLDVVTWNAMIFGHVKCGEGLKALELVQQMQQEGVQPDSVTFVRVLNACASLMGLEDGGHAHELIVQSGCESDAFMGSSWLTCMPNAAAQKMLAECSTRCHLEMWSLGPP
jgi:pentatricopeptide repeat protein